MEPAATVFSAERIVKGRIEQLQRDRIISPEIIIAKDQPPYNPLPARYLYSNQVCLSRWLLSAQELESVLSGHLVRLVQISFGGEFQSSLVRTVQPDLNHEPMQDTRPWGLSSVEFTLPPGKPIQVDVRYIDFNVLGVADDILVNERSLWLLVWTRGAQLFPLSLELVEPVHCIEPKIENQDPDSLYKNVNRRGLLA